MAAAVAAALTTSGAWDDVRRVMRERFDGTQSALPPVVESGNGLVVGQAGGAGTDTSSPAADTPPLVGPAPPDAAARDQPVLSAVVRSLKAGLGPASPYAWSTMLGTAGSMRAAVTDGARVWWVREGDHLPGDWQVIRIAVRPPGVTLRHGITGEVALPHGGGSGQRSGGVVPANAAATLSGSARVVDGDTLDVGGTRVRLHGIDAPESGQRCRSAGQAWACGREASRALAAFIGSRAVACHERDRDRYGRVVAVCRLDGRNMNAWMVAQGWALAYRRYSLDYVQAEAAARAARRGVWRGEVVAPWDWRRGTRLEP